MQTFKYPVLYLFRFKKLDTYFLHIIPKSKEVRNVFFNVKMKFAIPFKVLIHFQDSNIVTLSHFTRRTRHSSASGPVLYIHNSAFANVV